MVGIRTNTREEHSTDLDIETLRELVDLDDETREQIGNDIIALIRDEQVPITDPNEAERLALRRVLDQQYFDTNNFLAPTNDPAFQ